MLEDNPKKYWYGFMKLRNAKESSKVKEDVKVIWFSQRNISLFQDFRIPKSTKIELDDHKQQNHEFEKFKCENCPSKFIFHTNFIHHKKNCKTLINLKRS